MSVPVSRTGLSLLKRRRFLSRSVEGLGGIALASLMAEESRSAQVDPANPYAPRHSHCIFGYGTAGRIILHLRQLQR